MEISYQLADQYLKTLDPDAAYFTFQTFDDRPSKRSQLAAIFHGTLEQHFDTLKELNDQGAGIFVTVQETDGKGRRLENITTIRTVFFENDLGIDPSVLPLAPSLVTSSSPGKSHIYYLLDDPQPATPQFKDQFAGIMEHMVANGSDKNAKDLSRVLRLPGFFNNKYDDPHLVTLIPGRVKTYQWQTLVDTFKKPEPEIPQDMLEFLLGPFQRAEKPFAVARVASALQCIDADCDYDVWMRLGMAIHHASGGGSQGHDLYQQWSMRGSNYNQADWPSKWMSFRQNADKPVTIRTLYHIARTEFGWDGSYNSNLQHIRKLVALERANTFNFINRYYALLKSVNGLRIVRKTTDDLGRWTFGNISPQQAKILFENFQIPAWSKPDKQGNYRLTTKNAFDQWVAQEARHEFEGLIFEPDKSIINDLTDPKALPSTPKLNTYFGLHNEGNKGRWDNIQRHIMEVWCHGRQPVYDYIIGWLARVFQNPGEPGGTCVTIRSDRQGAGKNIIIDPLVKAFGVYGNVFSTPKQITGNFNALLAESIFIVLEEAVWAGNSHAKSFLKSAITSPFIMCERKFEDARTIKNCAHILCMSNAEWVVPIEPGDRRYFILDCDNKYCGNHSYFKTLIKQIKGGEADAMIHHLKTMDLSDFNVFKFPKSGGARSKAMEHNLDSVERFVMEALEQKDFAFAFNGFDGSGKISTDERNNIPKQIIYDSYKQFVDDNNNRRWMLATKTGFGMKLKKIFPESNTLKASTTRTSDSSIPVKSYLMASLYDLRKAYDEYLGDESAWETEPETEEELDIFA